MRTSIRRPAVIAATLVAALSLTLTACGGGGGTKDEGAAPSAAPAKAAGSGTGSGTGEEAAADIEGSQNEADTDAVGTSGSDTTVPAAQAGSRKKSGGKAPACTVDDVKISAAKQDRVPTTHITLTATNISGHSCTLVQYPLIAFSDVPQTAKDVPPVAKSKPETAIVLTAGAPAYAAVRLSDGGVDEENRAVHSFYVNLFAADGPAEGSKTVAAPKGGIAVDDAVAKTGYWTYELRNGADDF